MLHFEQLTKLYFGKYLLLNVLNAVQCFYQWQFKYTYFYFIKIILFFLRHFRVNQIIQQSIVDEAKVHLMSHHCIVKTDEFLEML